MTARFFLTWLIAWVWMTGTATAQPMSDRLQIGGAVTHTLTLTAEELKAFPADQISSLTVTRRVDGKDMSSTVRGIKLSALIERAGLPGKDRNDWKHLVVLASASDGYQVAFSWPELINTEVGSGVLVIFERDGQPLGETEGGLALVSARDLRTGPRHVKWLNKIEVSLL